MWGSSGFPTTAEICDQASQAKVEDCPSYNIVLVTLWHLREALNSYSGAIAALATIAIAAFTWTLWRSTDKLWKSAERQFQHVKQKEFQAFLDRGDDIKRLREQINIARENAEAGKLNAQALIEVERAHLFIIIRSDNVHTATRGVRLYGGPNSASMHNAQIMPPELEFVIRNTGRSTAVMRAVSYQLVQANAENTQWDFVFRDTIVNPVVLADSETEPPTACRLQRIWTIRDGSDAVVDETRPLFFFGFVTFSDTFKTDRQYFWRYQYRGNRFVLVDEEEQSPPSIS
jgi:hypothetical protein